MLAYDRRPFLLTSPQDLADEAALSSGKRDGSAAQNPTDQPRPPAKKDKSTWARVEALFRSPQVTFGFINGGQVTLDLDLDKRDAFSVNAAWSL